MSRAGPFKPCDGNADGNVGGRLRRPLLIFGAEGGAEGVDGLVLEVESDVCIDVGGDTDVRMSEEFFDHDEVDTLFEEEGGSGVP